MSTIKRTPEDAAYEAAGIRLDRMERAIAELAAEIKSLVAAIVNQTACVDRMERSVTRLVEGIEVQSKSSGELIAVIREQNAIVKQALDLARG